MLNDGFLITPFHNMALMCPDTTVADVDAHTKAFSVMCAELVGQTPFKAVSKNCRRKCMTSDSFPIPRNC